jgi:hypothetical protein
LVVVGNSYRLGQDDAVVVKAVDKVTVGSITLAQARRSGFEHVDVQQMCGGKSRDFRVSVLQIFRMRKAEAPRSKSRYLVYESTCPEREPNGMIDRICSRIPALTLALLVPSAALAVTPGEVRNLIVVDRDASTGEISIQFEPACAATDHHIEFGLVQDVAVPVYSGQICGIGDTGTYAGFNPGSGSYFFVVVGNDGIGVEGSYGTSFVGGLHAERPDDLNDPLCVFAQDLNERCDIPTVEMTAHRPQSEAYGAPFQRRAIPEEQELSRGVGIRVNGDDDDGNGTPDAEDANVASENDLIEVTLAASMPIPPDGLEYALVRTDGDIRVWSSSTKGTEILGASDSADLSFASGPITVWLEQPDVGTSDLVLVARRIPDQSVLASDELTVFAFTSVVIALGGENQVPADPPLEPENHGMFQVAIDLYELGYDVHMYDEDVVVASGAGAAFDEVETAVRDRAVGRVAIFGYSHGGGSTNDLARLLDQNRASIGTFSIDFTGYVDGIDNDSDFDAGAEQELPPSTAYHANYYQNPNCGFFELCGGPIAGADFDLDVTTTPWGAGLGHFTIDDAPNVTLGVIDQLIQQVTP